MIDGLYDAGPLVIAAMSCAVELFGQHVAHVPLCGPDSARDDSGALTLAPETRDLGASVLAARWDINHATAKALAEDPCGICTKPIRQRNGLVRSIRIRTRWPPHLSANWCAAFSPNSAFYNRLSARSTAQPQPLRAVADHHQL